MHRTKNRIFIFVKWLVLLAAYSFLVYKLAHVEYWNELKISFLNHEIQRFVYFAAILFLMPLNWAIETAKWQLLLSGTVSQSFGDALKSVLAGLNTGFVTPNRIGEFAGRILLLPPAHRPAGVAMSVINSVTQNIIIVVVGLAGAVVYFSEHYSNLTLKNYLIILFSVISITLLIYFLFPSFIGKLKTDRWSKNLRNAVNSLAAIKRNKLSAVLGISAVRYCVFCLQFYLMLLFFNIEISPLQALAAIPVMYLLITFTPSLAAAEPAIRGSAAVFIFSVYSPDEVGILLTGILIWLVNFVVPMLVGSVLIGIAPGSDKNE
ncbi:MAG: lysylphosphatidylglycerol synthase domain-containing protein [Paludibacteraceae bacterium]